MPRLLVRFKARLRGLSLDRRLLAGEDPARDPALAERVDLLLDPERRRGLAEQIDTVIDVAANNGSRGVGVPIRRAEIVGSGPVLHSLARELAEAEDVAPRGVILTERLLRDGRSPLYFREADMTLDTAARQARAALHLG